MHVRPPVLCMAALLLVVTAVVGACNPEGSPLGRSTAVWGDPTCQVGVIGDSLIVGARDTGGLVQKFQQRGCSVTNVDARVSRPISEGARVAEAWAAFGVMPRILVVALGTNECSGPAFEANARRILAAAGPDRPVVWVNTWRPGCDVAVNGVIGRLQFDMRSRPDAGNMWILDHWGFLRANRGLLARDGIHMNPAGYRAHADRIVQAVLG